MAPNLRAARQFAGGSGGSSVVKVKEVVLNFDAALSYQPLALAPGDIVVSIDAEVTTIFNAAGESVAVGLTGTPNKYFAPGAVNLNVLGITSVLAIDQIAVASQTLITFVRGAGGTQGQVRFLIRYVPQAQTLVIPSLISIAVTPASPTLAGGGVVQAFTAIGTFSDLTTQDITAGCVWASSVPGAATIVAGTGVATTTGGGATVISATQGAISGNTTLTVTAVLVSITVSPLVPIAPNIIVPGATQQYKAVGTYSDASTADISGAVIWSTTTPLLVGVGALGLVTGIANGLGNVRAVQGAITGNGVQDIRTISTLQWVRRDGTVTAAVTVPNTLTGYDFSMLATYTDLSQAFVDPWVTFGTSNALVLTMAAGGLLTAVADGLANAEATYFGVLYPLPVTVKTLVSLALSYPFAQMPQNQFMAATLIGTFSDLSTADLRDMATYTSDDAIIVILNTPTAFGEIHSGTLAGYSTAPAEDANLQATIGAVLSPLVLITVDEIIGGLLIAVDVNPVGVGNTTTASSSGTYNTAGGPFNLTAFTIFSTVFGPTLAQTGFTTFVGVGPGFQNVYGTIPQANPGAAPANGSTPVTVV